MFDWAEEKTAELGTKIADGLAEAYEEALIPELAVWFKECASDHAIRALHLLAKAVGE